MRVSSRASAPLAGVQAQLHPLELARASSSATSSVPSGANVALDTAQHANGATSSFDLGDLLGLATQRRPRRAPARRARSACGRRSRGTRSRSARAPRSAISEHARAARRTTSCGSGDRRGCVDALDEAGAGVAGASRSSGGRQYGRPEQLEHGVLVGAPPGAARARRTYSARARRVGRACAEASPARRRRATLARPAVRPTARRPRARAPSRSSGAEAKRAIAPCRTVRCDDDRELVRRARRTDVAAPGDLAAERTRSRAESSPCSIDGERARRRRLHARAPPVIFRLGRSGPTPVASCRRPAATAASKLARRVATSRSRGNAEDPFRGEARACRP